jgi:hypothetical protein
MLLRRLCVAILGSAMLVFWALPASAASGGAHTFSIPGVYGVGAWGSYQHVGPRMRVTVCVRDLAPGVYGGAAAAVATRGRHRQTIAAVVVGFQHTACRTMTSAYTGHLAVDALSGYQTGKVRQVGHIRQIY